MAIHDQGANSTREQQPWRQQANASPLQSLARLLARQTADEMIRYPTNQTTVEEQEQPK
jgi:hypothetical protein